ncbi:MAG TPA: hypothetical protein VFK35_09640 [Candidatus Limnocylindrales bacterium]|nr:hypothetical protein [Candidatus Limnocylindrales bacterium]
MRISSVLKHSGQAVLEGALVSLLVVGLMAGTAFAGRPGGSNATSPFSVADGSFGQTTTAQRGSSTATWVRARCYQGGNLVYEQYVSYGGGQSVTLTLGPTPMWSSGAATCTGEEGWWRNGSRWRVVGSDDFTVSG